MLDYINCGQVYNVDLESADILGDKLEYPLFKGQDIIIGEKAELIAGNYKVEVLKEYLRYLKSLENKRQWICDIYNKGIVQLYFWPS